MANENLSLIRQANKWLLDNNVVTIEVLEDIRYFLLIRFREIRKVEIECDTENFYMKIFIKIKWFYRPFIRRKKLFTFIQTLVNQYIPNYAIEVING